ncbi:MAG: chemotaxis protein CheB [Dissulfurimicrobium sp.]|uniref:chemotaxis protein CheB n=1 Tax=Dissulfurimicrobium sp. TaxID=2022436 RepID=UPI004048F017
MQELQASPMSGDNSKKIRILVVDDSPLMCKVLTRLLSEEPTFQVVGQALNGKDAIEALLKMPCDVCTLDVHMPGMSGLSALKHIMIRSPLPILMVSAFTSEGSKVTFEALRYGAVDFFQKPSQEKGEDIDAQKAILKEKVKRAARVQVKAARYLRLSQVSGLTNAQGSTGHLAVEMPDGIIAISASTGGYASLLSLLPLVSNPSKPIIVFMRVQPEYLRAFVNYLGAYVPFNVRLAKDREVLHKGVVYFINSDDAASLEQEGSDMLLRVTPRPKLSDKESGFDLFLYSASEHFGHKVLAIFLSGDGAEGLSGAREVLRLEGRVLVQSPETCLAPETPALIAAEPGVETCLINDIAKRI